MKSILLSWPGKDRQRAFRSGIQKEIRIPESKMNRPDSAETTTAIGGQKDGIAHDGFFPRRRTAPEPRGI